MVSKNGLEIGSPRASVHPCASELAGPPPTSSSLRGNFSLCTNDLSHLFELGEEVAGDIISGQARPHHLMAALSARTKPGTLRRVCIARQQAELIALATASEFVIQADSGDTAIEAGCGAGRKRCDTETRKVSRAEVNSVTAGRVTRRT